MKKAIEYRRVNPDRDLSILVYLWYWKLATTNSIYLKFFQTSSMKAAYNRLNKLERHGYMQVINLGHFGAWSLTKNGFGLIKDRLPELSEVGFKSEFPKHDLLCSLVHQGSTIFQSNKSLEFVTEQELRRLEEELLPSWTPSSISHRPDGYWRVNKKYVAALEIETTIKTKKRLEEIMKFYGDYRNIHRVLWVVPSRTSANLVLKYETKYLCERGRKHNIVLLKDLLNSLWGANISFGPETNQTVQHFIGEKALGNPWASSGTSQGFPLFDVVLYPRKNKEIKKNLRTAFID